jgi:type I restriction-modification system DNA methylase subunit
MEAIDYDETYDVTENNNISNDDALKEKIHEIHNYLRNNGAGYGMNALKVFNIIYGLKKIEEKGLTEIYLKNPKSKFSYLLELANTYEPYTNMNHEILTNLIYNDVLDDISKSKLRPLLFYEIPKHIKAKTFVYLVKEINSITEVEKSCNVLLSGKIYEYFIGRDKTAISEMGAYFTNRHIVDYIYEEVNIELNEDGSVPVMIDMFGGSGGFTTGYINYMNKNYSNEIDWKNNIDNIYHYDMNEEVIMSAGLEILCLTGELPNYENNLKSINTFTYEFDRKFKNIFTNPPYGGDKDEKTDKVKKNDKIVSYIKNLLKNETSENKIKSYKQQLKDIDEENKRDKRIRETNYVSLENSSKLIQNYAKKYNLKSNDKEGCSLILQMAILDTDGLSVGVLKEGVFFNSKYKELRKHLIDNYNVKEVISIPNDQFENTTTKTSIVIFENTEQKTSKIIFKNLNLIKHTEDKFEEINGKIYLIQNKGDVANVNDDYISEATIEELHNNKLYSLLGKDYNKKELICADDYKLVKLGDICEFKPKSTKIFKEKYRLVKIKDINNNTITNFDEIDFDKVKETNICQYNDILISNVRPKSTKTLFLTKNSVDKLDDICFTLPYLRIKKYDPLFIYSMLYSFVDNFEKELCTGSTYPTFKIEQLKNYSIPIPKDPEKIQYWNDRINEPFNNKNEIKNKILELETYIQNKIKDITENKECDEVLLGDLCEINSGKMLSKQQAIAGDYNVYGGGNSSYTHNIYNYEGFNIIISRVGNNNISIVNEKFYLTDNGFTFIIKNINIYKYIAYYLKINQNIISNISNGSAQDVVSKSRLSNLKIKIPKNKKLITKLEPKFQEIEQLKLDLVHNEKLYKQYIQELKEDAIISY